MTDNAGYHRYWEDRTLLVASTDKTVISKEIADNVVVTGTIENFCLVSLEVKRQGGGNLVDGSFVYSSSQPTTKDVIENVKVVAEAINDVITACANIIESEMFEAAV